MSSSKLLYNTFPLFTKTLYRVEATIRPAGAEFSREEDIDLFVRAIRIAKQDSYETCVKKLDKLTEEYPFSRKEFSHKKGHLCSTSG